VPEQLRSDNGPEFIVQDWLKAQEIKTLYIKPGSPWENGHIESFHDKLRDECLNPSLGLVEGPKRLYCVAPS
jgi:putative transposase